MNKTTPSTSLRIRWAKALGWQKHLHKDSWTNHWGETRKDDNLPPIDANTVRMALMGMTHHEWSLFANKLAEKHQFPKTVHPETVICYVLKTPPETLAEIYCEVKGITE